MISFTILSETSSLKNFNQRLTNFIKRASGFLTCHSLIVNLHWWVPQTCHTKILKILSYDIR